MLSFSQTTYPKRILWNNDTVLAITKEQLVKINRSLNDYIHLRESHELLQMDMHVSDSLVKIWKNIALLNDTVGVLEHKRFMESEKKVEFLTTTIKEQNIKSRKINIGVGVGGTLCGILLGWLLGK